MYVICGVLMSMNILISGIRVKSREIVRQLGLSDGRFASIGSISQCYALLELNSKGMMNLKELSKVLNLDKSTTSRLVSQLLENGLCDIQGDNDDRRNKLIFLTDKGLKAIAHINEEAELEVKQALEMMNEEERNTVFHGLSIYAKALRKSHVQKKSIIRVFEEDDSSQLKTIIRQVRAEFGFDETHPSAKVSEKELDQMYEVYSQNENKYFVIEYNGEIIGGGGYSPLIENEEICELRNMYIASEFRSFGLGGILLQRILKEAQIDGFKRCYLETQESMSAANTLYKKHGFQPLDKPIVDTGHNWTNCWYMKELYYE